MKYRISVFITLVVMLAAGTAWAHHNASNIEPYKRVMLTGTLTKVDWRNPHIRISLEVKGDKGQAESWLLEGRPPNYFAGLKIYKADFEKAIGQTVTVEVGPARDGSRYGNFGKITFPDGREVVNKG